MDRERERERISLDRHAISRLRRSRHEREPVIVELLSYSSVWFNSSALFTCTSRSYTEKKIPTLFLALSVWYWEDLWSGLVWAYCTYIRCSFSSSLPFLVFSFASHIFPWSLTHRNPFSRQRPSIISLYAMTDNKQTGFIFYKHSVQF